jgi:hypothetical protein
VQIVSLVGISIVDVGGDFFPGILAGGGRGMRGNGEGGGGGGAGGAILLEAPAIRIGGGRLAANGGGGGAGGSGTSGGSADGANGTFSASPAAGGAGANPGGSGGALPDPAGQMGFPLVGSAFDTGGGGGAAGRIALRALGGGIDLDGEVISPAPDQGALALD